MPIPIECAEIGVTTASPVWICITPSPIAPATPKATASTAMKSAALATGSTQRPTNAPRIGAPGR